LTNILENSLPVDKVYVINLKRRPDRLKKWISNNSKFFSNEQLYVFEAIEPNQRDLKQWSFEPGALGCLESHLGVIKHARDHNYGNILIFEDDCVLKENFNTLFFEHVEVLPNNWNMFYLFSQHYLPANDHNNLLVKCNSTLSTVAYMLNKASYNFLIELLELKSKQVDVIFAQLHYIIDAYASKNNLCDHEDLFDSDVVHRKLAIKLNLFQRFLLKIQG
jgi:glycosyl transferase family 25